MNSLNFNGQIYPSEEAVFRKDNRAFRFGDGLYESMRVFEGKILFLHRHWERLQLGMTALGIEAPEAWNPRFFQLQCLRVVPDKKANYRLRFTLWRGGEGKYRPASNQAQYLISCEALEQEPYPRSQEGLYVGLFSDIPIASNLLSQHKTLNALPYIQAARFSQMQGWDDCLLQNTHQRLVEASSSNLFLIKGKKVFTPPLSEGGLAGIMRSVILDIAHHVNLTPKELPITEADLLSADEVFLTNSIQGIKWVSRYKSRTFTSVKTLLLNEHLNFFVR